MSGSLQEISRAVHGCGLTLFALLLLASCSTINEAEVAVISPENIEYEVMDSLSYALGVQLGENLRDQGFSSINATDLAAGIEDLNIDQLKFGQDTALVIMQRYIDARTAEEEDQKRRSAELYLADKKSEPNIIQLPSGLIYEVLWDGDMGEPPGRSDMVKVHMEGRMLNGDILESTYNNRSPATIAVSDQIPGLVEGLQLMSPGAKFKFILSPEIAYGEKGSGRVGAWEVLEYEVELLEVLKSP